MLDTESLNNLDRILTRFRFDVGHRTMSSGPFDRALAEALRGKPERLFALRDAYAQRRVAWLLLGLGVTAFDAWAFYRAVLALQFPLFDCMAEMGLLTGARCANVGTPIAHHACAFDTTRRTLPILKAAGVDLDACDYDGKTPLQGAIDGWEFELAADLVSLGVDATPIMTAQSDAVELEYLRELIRNRHRTN